MINFNDVYKAYTRGEEVLKGISFDLNPGAMAFLTGHSGAGKTTLLKLIAGIEPITRGEILVAGKNIKNLSNLEVAKLRRSIGMVLQDPMLLENRNVFENVALPLTIADFPAKDIRGRVTAALNMVNLEPKAKRFPLALSAGEKQRVSIARAIVARPSILLADEPTGNLDPDLAEEIMNLFIKFNQSGVTTLIASHNITLLDKLGGKVLTLDGGKLRAN